MAVGGSRRAAYNAGIPVRATVCLTYVVSGVLTGLAGTLYAARLSGAGPDTGLGLELNVVTAALLGGNSVGGGRGSVGKALIGADHRLAADQRARPARPGKRRVVDGGRPGAAARHRASTCGGANGGIGCAPRSMFRRPISRCRPRPQLDAGAASPYAINDRLREVEIIGLGEVDGPEDVILDEDDHLYCSVRQGEIVRFLAPDYVRREVYAHVGGRPLGMAFDRDGGLVVCIAGMGLYRVDKQRNVHKLTAETNRSPFSIIDDSRMRLADDLDIAPDGKIYFSEATIRYGFEEWVVDALEGRGNGRIIRYDPATRHDADDRCAIFCSPTACASRTTASRCCSRKPGAAASAATGSRARRPGTIELVIADLPGYPDNINRGSRGTYWVALAGTRTPSYDLAMTMPAFRRRMARRVAGDEWLFPNVNVGCVVHFDANGGVLETLWDLAGENHPAITSMREHRGYLYLGGVTNNRIGRIKLADADPEWTGPGVLLGSAPMNPFEQALGPMVRPRRCVDHDAADGRRLPSQRSARRGRGRRSRRRRPTRLAAHLAAASSSPPAARCFASTSRASAPVASFDAEISALAGLPDGGAAVGARRRPHRLRRRTA